MHDIPASSLTPCKDYLCSWHDIMHALRRPNNSENRRCVRKLNIDWDGPILLPTKGKQPMVCKEELLRWWDSIAERIRERQQKYSDTKGTVAPMYQYGREEFVHPEISGHLKKRHQTSRLVESATETSGECAVDSELQGEPIGDS